MGTMNEDKRGMVAPSKVPRMIGRTTPIGPHPCQPYPTTLTVVQVWASPWRQRISLLSSMRRRCSICSSHRQHAVPAQRAGSGNLPVAHRLGAATSGHRNLVIQYDCLLTARAAVLQPAF